MARAIGLLRILAFSVHTPDELLGKLNERLCEGNETSIFLTLFCGFLDVKTGLLQYSNGGHLAPLVVSKTESTLLPLPTGPLIGAFPGVTFSSRTFMLETGDLLLGYTDGITEAENALGEQFSEQRCLSFLAKRHSDSLQESVDGLRQQVQSFTGVDTLEDDGALLAIRRTRC